MGATRDPIAYHLLPVDAWAAAPPDEPLRVPSLATEGFVHLTHRMVDLVDVANARSRDDPRPHVVLTIALRWLTAPWRYDGDERYPHAYGPIDRAAITEVRPIDRLPDGAFLPIERPDARQAPDMPALLAMLADTGLDFVVVGSSAAALLGADLEPGDLDICPERDPVSLGRLAGVLRTIGARPRVGVPGWVTPEERETYVARPSLESLDYLFETPLGDLDILFEPVAGDGRGVFTYPELAASAVRVTVAGRSIAVASPAHLRASKLGARRPKDLRARDALERLAGDGTAR